MRIFSALLLLAGASSAWAVDPDFVLINKTGHDFEAVYVSSEQDKDWNGNILPNGKVLKAGGELKVDFPKRTPEMIWDLNVVDDSGVAVEFHKIDLKDVETITLLEKNGKVEAVVK